MTNTYYCIHAETIFLLLLWVNIQKNSKEAWPKIWTRINWRIESYHQAAACSTVRHWSISCTSVQTRQQYYIRNFKTTCLYMYACMPCTGLVIQSSLAFPGSDTTLNTVTARYIFNILMKILQIWELQDAHAAGYLCQTSAINHSQESTLSTDINEVNSFTAAFKKEHWGFFFLMPQVLLLNTDQTEKRNYNGASQKRLQQLFYDPTQRWLQQVEQWSVRRGQMRAERRSWGWCLQPGVWNSNH